MVQLSPRPKVDTASAWEAYWSKAAENSTPILWESDTESAAEQDLPRFKQFMNPELPLIDFACGHGNQSDFLAQHFPRVMGVDVAKSAIDLAKSQFSAPNLEFRVLDALKPEQAEALHAEIGDVNIYMRTGFHHICPEKRATFVESLGILLGRQGVLYMIELGSTADERIGSMVERPEIQAIFEQGLRPGSISQQDIAHFFSDYEVLAFGEALLRQIIKVESGDFARVPGFYATLRRK